MDKYLYFMEETDGAFDAANDSITVPLKKVKAFRNTDTTEFTIELLPMLGYADSNDATLAGDQVVCTITANKHKEVMQDIVAKINAHPNGDPVIVVSDDSNSVFASQYITGCSITVTAEA
tara:strand:- start:289 stop:648 length:360 start_codon:yes stop_codon:yes gene_type:complete